MTDPHEFRLGPARGHVRAPLSSGGVRMPTYMLFAGKARVVAMSVIV